jgi:hypothetical protein
MLPTWRRWSCVLLFVGCVHAQSVVLADSATKSEWNAFYAKQSAMRQRGTEVLGREQARSKADLCAKSETGGQAAVGACLGREGKTTEQDYLAYTRSIGALLRLAAPDASKPKVSKSIPFDVAEDRGAIIASRAAPPWQINGKAAIRLPLRRRTAISPLPGTI